MIQTWLLTIAYFLFTSLMLFLDEYRTALGFLLRVKHNLIVDRRFRIFFTSAGLVLCLLNILIPMDPGPVLLGDLLPALLCLFIAAYFARFADEDRRTYLKLSDRTCAIMLVAFTAVHFICPALVLL